MGAKIEMITQRMKDYWNGFWNSYRMTKREKIHYGLGMSWFIIWSLLIPSNSIVWRLLPALGIFWALGVTVLAIRHHDEMERRIDFESAAYAGILTAFVGLASGLLESVGLPALNTFELACFMLFAWGVISLILRKKYV